MSLTTNAHGSLLESLLSKISKCDKFAEILPGINTGLCPFEMK